MRTTIFSIILLLSSYSFAQNIQLQQLELSVNKGFCRGYSKKCEKTQVRYITACNELGDYYFGVKKYKTALKYYQLVAYLGTYTDGDLDNDSIIEFRNKVAAKAGDIYFYGKGVKKNKSKAFYFHNRVPTFYNSILERKYSELYFGDAKHFYNFSTDSIYNFGANPFYLKSQSNDNYFEPFLKEIENRLQANTKLECKVEINYGLLSLNVINQSYLHGLLDNIKAGISKNIIARFSFEVVISETGYVYKSLILPRLSMELKETN